HIYHFSQNSHSIISFNAEKALTRVNSQYLLLTLDKFGSRKSFISQIKLLYSKPNTHTLTNSKISSPHPVLICFGELERDAPSPLSCSV
uniref:Uncharacterized protein n=1 Tax=Gopherus agassizii TaxID=38772 RepID=A0A452I4T5_9SAUR